MVQVEEQGGVVMATAHDTAMVLRSMDWFLGWKSGLCDDVLHAVTFVR
jgi:hypothetical protein